MWKITLNVKCGAVISTLEYSYEKKIMRYFDLYVLLPDILKSLRIKDKYDPYNIKFSFLYGDKIVPVKDWSEYVLKGDIINIDLTILNKFYLSGPAGDIIYFSDKLEDVYNFYLNHKFFYPVLVKHNNRLLDVLDNPKNWLDACITRLILKYNY